jgi:hypothetical protein
MDFRKINDRSMPRDAKWVAASAHRAEVFTVKCQHDMAEKV